MPQVARFQMPDGRIGRFEVPEGTTPEQAQQMIQESLAQAPEQAIAPTPQKSALQPTTASGVASEIGKGLVRGPMDIGMAITRIPPFGGPLTGMLAEYQAAPLRKIIAATPTTPTEQFAGTIAEILGANAIGGGFATVRNAVMSALSALGGATGEQVGGETGKVVGSVLPAVGAVASIPVAAAYRAGRNLIDPVLPGGTERSAARGLSELLAARRGAVETELKAPQAIVPGSAPTAAEAAVRAGSTELAGAQKLAAQRIDPSGYRDIEKGQEAARLSSLLSFGKDKAAIEAAEAARDAATGPLREVSLESANMSGRYLPALLQKAAERGATASEQADIVRRVGAAGERAEALGHTGRMRLDSGVPPAGGLVRVPERYSYGQELSKVADRATTTAAERSLQAGKERRFVEMQARSLSEHGYFPLQSDQIAMNISRIQNTPGNRTNTVLQKAMDDVKELLAKGTNNNGIIDSRDLYTIRKSEVANIVKKYADENKNWDQRFTAGLVMRVRGMIDNAIEGAGGTMWKSYLSKYAESSRQIGEMEIGQKLAETLRQPTEIGERASAFASAMRDIPKTTKSATGFSYERLDEALTPQNVHKVNAVLADMLRKREFEQMATKGFSRASDIMKAVVPDLPPTGMFQPLLSATRSWINRAAGVLDKKALTVMSEALKTPQGTLVLMSKMPAELRQEFIKQARVAAYRASIMGGAAASEEQRQEVK